MHHGMACITSRHGKLRRRFVTVWRALATGAAELIVAEIKVLRAGKGRCPCQVLVSSTGGAFICRPFINFPVSHGRCTVCWTRFLPQPCACMRFVHHAFTPHVRHATCVCIMHHLWSARLRSCQRIMLGLPLRPTHYISKLFRNGSFCIQELSECRGWQLVWTDATKS